MLAVHNVIPLCILVRDVRKCLCVMFLNALARLGAFLQYNVLLKLLVETVPVTTTLSPWPVLDLMAGGLKI